jgi:trigger factor
MSKGRSEEVELNVSVEDLSPGQKRLHIEIPARKVQQAIDKRYRDLSSQVRIKGFRPGKVPRNILKSYYGKSIEHEVTSQFIEESFPQALRESDIKPLVEAEVDESKFNENGALVYAAIVEVCPPFELADYKGLLIRRSRAAVTDEMVEAEIARLREENAELKTIELERGVRYGDIALIQYRWWPEGADTEKIEPSEQMVDVGKNKIHPDFDEHLVGHFSGDSLDFVLDQPEADGSSQGSPVRIHYEVTIREVKEKTIPDLNDEFAQTLGQFETLEDLRKEISRQLQHRIDDQISGEVRKQIADHLLERMQFEVPPKVIEREVEQQLSTFKYQFQSQGLKIDPSVFETPEIRAEYRSQAERNVRLGLILNRIAEQEGLTLTDEEVDEVYQGMARMARMSLEEVKRSYADSPLIEQAKEGKIKEKVFSLIEEHSVVSDSPPEGSAIPEAVESTEQE